MEKKEAMAFRPSRSWRVSSFDKVESKMTYRRPFSNSNMGTLVFIALGHRGLKIAHESMYTLLGRL